MAADSRRPAADDASLRACFVTARPDLDAPAALGPALRATLDAARAAWPEATAQPDDRFVRFLAAKLPEGAPAQTALDALHTADLYLACACAHGDRRALARFEQFCTAITDRAAARLNATAEQRDEVRRTVHQLLMVPRSVGASGPAALRIHDFSGRGSLAAWVKVVAVRETLALLRRRRRERAAQSEALALEPEAEAGPELVYLKRLYRDEFKAAFAEAVEALSEGERTLLRQHALEGLTIDHLAARYRIHRATAARRVEAARATLLKTTRLALTRRLRAGPDELESVMRLLQSQFDITLPTMLRRDEAPAEDAPARPDAPDERKG